MRVERYPLGALQANCYLIWKDKHVLIVDPGGSSRKIVEYIAEQAGIVDGILLTHGHFDHIGGVDYFAKQYHCDVYISSEDSAMLKDTRLNCSVMSKPFTTEIPTRDYDIQNHIGVFNFEAILAPGHSNGCTLLVFDDFMCCGDVLFKNSIGRCDLPTGSDSKMKQSLQHIKTMNPDLIVYPGHGEETTLYEEFLHNPYLES